MRISRMLEMIYLLLKKRQMTSKELAEHFNVSTKTIYRDVDELANVGIPISMQQGVKGGIVLNDDYAINKTKLTSLETESLLKALEGIKKLPNAKLNYVLGMLKQYFNEAGTLWVNTNDVALDMQNKFHQVKSTIIECSVIDFQYYNGREFIKYHVEPYELRIRNDIWSVVIRNISTGIFEELYIARIKDIIVKSKHFSRREIPQEFLKKNTDISKVVRFEILELSDEILNRFPIEDIKFIEDKIYLDMKVTEIEENERVISRYNNLRLIGNDEDKKR